MPLVTSPAHLSPEGAHGKAQACTSPCDSEAPNKNHMSLHPESLPPNFSHLDPLPPSQPEQAGLCLGATVCKAGGWPPRSHPEESTHANVFPCPVALLSPFHGGRPSQLQGGRGKGTQVRALTWSLCRECPLRGPVPLGLSKQSGVGSWGSFPRQRQGWGSLVPSWPAC